MIEGFDSRFNVINHTFFFLYRLQTGMRGAFGKPQGTVARVNIGQVILSVRTKDSHKASAIEAFRRAKFKFPGRQKVRCGDGNERFSVIKRILSYADFCLKEIWFYQVVEGGVFTDETGG